MPPSLDPTATRELAAGARHDLDAGDITALVRRCGAHPVAGGWQLGWWIPATEADETAPVEVEVLTPLSPLDLSAPRAEVSFARHRLAATRTGPFAWAVVEGLTPGDRQGPGDLYRAWVDTPAGPRLIDDPLALSRPFGMSGPAEAIDPAELHADRADRDYLRARSSDAITRRRPPVNLLQVHPRTSTPSGTLGALAAEIRRIGAKVAACQPLDPAEALWLDHDAIELLPVEPTIDLEEGPYPWQELGGDADTVTAVVCRQAATNWGYDVTVAGGAALNPALLDAGRPHELVDLIAACHTFPRPLGLVLDVVYGHADNQALRTVPHEWFTGPDMYGQHLDYRHPIVRAHLLEILRRKAGFGADGIRVDGAQDFTWWDDEAGCLRWDDELMVDMSDQVVEVPDPDGEAHRWRCWMVFEDGRPWPRDDWELSSTYRAVTEVQDHVFQWGPLTFAHNTPFRFTFWAQKWWRMEEIARFGSRWISGCANHDTVRRGAQVDPSAAVNTNLGGSPPSIIEAAYDHPAATLLFHGFLPGVPMEFLHALARAPWSFVRNTDHRYAIKVWAEEGRLLHWRVPPEVWAHPDTFPRLKAAGFTDRQELVELMDLLGAAVALHGDDTAAVVRLVSTLEAPIELDAETLTRTARAWMDDVHDLCQVHRWSSRLDAGQVDFGRAARRIRLERPWLLENLDSDDLFRLRTPVEGAVVYVGRRRGPEGNEVAIIVNMEGARTELVPAEELGISDTSGWQTLLTTPGLTTPGMTAPGTSGPVALDRPLVLGDASGVLFTR